MFKQIGIPSPRFGPAESKTHIERKTVPKSSHGSRPECFKPSCFINTKGYPHNILKNQARAFFPFIQQQQGINSISRLSPMTITKASQN